MRPPLARASFSSGTIFSGVRPPPRFDPVWTLPRYWLSISPEAKTIPGRLDRLSTAPRAPKPVVSPGGVVESTGGARESDGVVVLVSTGTPALSTGGEVAGVSTDGLRPSLPPQAAAKTRKAPDITVRSMGHLPEHIW